MVPPMAYFRTACDPRRALREAEMAALDFRLQAAAFVIRGAWMVKFLMGKSSAARHKKFFKVMVP